MDALKTRKTFWWKIHQCDSHL